MEDDKLAAYYDELTRKGGGAARYKQGLGFSSSSATNDDVPSRGSALPTASSFLSKFVRASSPSKTSEFEKQGQIQSIQNKLSKKPKEKTRNFSPSRDEPSRNSSRSSDRYSSRDKPSRNSSRSRSRSPIRRERSRDRKSRRRSRSRSRDRYSRRRSRSRDRRSLEKKTKRNDDRKGDGIDFAKMIEGYDHLTPAERVKARMKIQLSKTAENDESIGKGSGWERFNFDKDAPLDDEEIEAAEDDAVLVKHIGQSFRFSAVETRKEEKLKSAHDEAMFGGSSFPPPEEKDDEEEENIEKPPLTNLLSDQVLTMQQGSWRDRARKK